MSKIRVKVVRRAVLKLRVLPRLPADLMGANFITVNRDGLAYTISVDYSLLAPGPINDPATSFAVVQDQDAGIYKSVSIASLLVSGLDLDLQAIAALTGTGILVRSAANTWVQRSVVGGASITVTNGDGVSGNISVAVTDPELVALAGLVSAADRLPYFTGSGTASLATFTAFGRSLVDDVDAATARTTLGVVIGTDVQAFDSDLAAIAALATNGLIARTGSGTVATRTLQSAAAGLTWTNGDGVAGNPTPVLANDLAALEGLASTGIARRTGTDAWSVGTAVANSELATAAANTLKGNPTGSTATPTDFTIASLTQKATPVGTDEMLIADNAAGGALKRALVSALSGGGSGVASLNGQTGALVLHSQPQGRVTLASGVAVMTSTYIAATVYYTPSNGNICPIYDGTQFVPTVFTQLSQATTDTSKSPAACAANSNYDLFVWNDSGTLRCTRGPAWTSNTARGTGAGTSEIDFTTAYPTNKVAITNGPAANRGTWVGSISTNASSQVDYNIGGSANGGVAGSLGVWNMYNRNLAIAASVDTTSYAYSTATLRQAHASAGNQVSVLVGLAVDVLNVNFQTRISTAATLSASTVIAIGEDSTTVAASAGVTVQTPAAAIFVASPIALLSKVPLLGFHTYTALEAGNGSASNTINSASNAALSMQVWN